MALEPQITAANQDVAALTQQQNTLQVEQNAAALARQQEGEGKIAALQGQVGQEQGQVSSMLAQGAPKVAQPQAPQGPVVDPNVASNFVGLLLGMASIAGHHSGNYMGAASALSGALKGFNEGSEENAQRGWQEFQQKFKAAQTEQARVDDQFREVLRDKSTSINQKLMEIRNLGEQYNRPDLTMAARAQNLKAIEDQLKARTGAREKLEAEQARLAEQAMALAAQRQNHQDMMRFHEEQLAAQREYHEQTLGIQREKLTRAAQAKTGVLGPAVYLQKTLGLPENVQIKPKDATNIVSAAGAVAGVDDLLDRLKDPAIRTGLQAGLTNIQEKAESLVGGDGELSSDVMNQLISGAISDTDKNSVILKDALFNSFEVEKAAAGGRLTVQMMKMSSPLLDPTNYTKEGYAAVLGGRRKALITQLRGNGLDDTMTSKLVTDLRRQQPNVTTPPGAPPATAQGALAPPPGFEVLK